MSRPQRALLACLMAILLLAAAGCGGQDDAGETDEAKRLIDKANTISDETAALEERMNELWPKISRIDPAENAAAALAMLDDAEAGYEEMTKNQESVAKLYDQVSKLDVSDKLKTWAGQQKEIADLSIKATAVLQEFVAKDKVLFSLWNQLSRANRDKLIKELNDLDAKRMDLWTQASDLRQASQQYFIDNVVGETGAFESSGADGSGRGWTVVAGIGSVVAAALSAFVCGYIARRKNRNVAGWAVAGFLLPLVAVIIILLLARKKPRIAAATAAPRPGRLIPPRQGPRRRHAEDRTAGQEGDDSG